jgi:hypothetical protein
VALTTGDRLALYDDHLVLLAAAVGVLATGVVDVHSPGRLFHQAVHHDDPGMSSILLATNS